MEISATLMRIFENYDLGDADLQKAVILLNILLKSHDDYKVALEIIKVV